MIRSYKFIQEINKEKSEHVTRILLEYRRIAKIILNKQLTVFFKTGKLELSNKMYKSIDTFLSERYKDGIKRQVDGILKSWISNRKNNFVDIVYKSPLSKKEKKELFSINYHNEWFKQKNFLARKIFKEVLSNNKFPCTKHINMQITTMIYQLQDSNNSIYSYWIKLCTEDSGKFIYIPLKQNTYFDKQKGEVCNGLELTFKNNNLDIIVLKVNKKKEEYTPKLDKISIDVGLKTLLTTSEGDFYSQRFIDKLNWYDNRIIALQKELQKRDPKYKLSTNKRYNKLNKQLRDFVKNEINRVINCLVKTHKPAEIVAENLNFSNSNLSKRINRLLNKFGMSILNKKLKYLSDEKGIKINKVNPAYTSQECERCGYTDIKNRKDESFKCLFCGHKAHADSNSTKTIDGRSADERITVYTKKEQVLQFLVDDFVKKSVGQGFSLSSLSSAPFNENKHLGVYRSSAMSFFDMK